VGALALGVGLGLNRRLRAVRPFAIRQIASNVRPPGFNGSGLSNGTDTTANMVSAHWNESGQDISELATLDVGWALDASSESDLTDTFTITRSFSYPFNTTIVGVVTWDSGSASKAIAPGVAPYQSDWTALASIIPDGAKFGVHTYITVAPSKKYPTCGNGSTALGERKQTGTGLSDLSQATTVPLALSGGIYRPTAILGRGAGLRYSLAGVGDSIMAGAADIGFNTRGGTGMFGRAAEGVIPFLHTGYSGQQAALNAVAGKLDRRKALFAAAGITHIVCDYGVNDLTYTSAQIISNQGTIWASLAGIVNVNGETPRIVQTTITPVSTSSDFWNTLGGQAATANNAKRAAANTNIRALPSPLFGYIEMADALEPARDDGRWATGSAFSPHLRDPANGTVLTGSSPTSVVTDLGGAANFWAFGYLKFTSGALAGTIVSPTASAGGTITVPALASAPAPGDTVTAYPLGCRPTGDGLHPAVQNSAAPGYGGIYIGVDLMTPIFTSYQ